MLISTHHFIMILCSSPPARQRIDMSVKSSFFPIGSQLLFFPCIAIIITVHLHRLTSQFILYNAQRSPLNLCSTSMLSYIPVLLNRVFRLIPSCMIQMEAYGRVTYLHTMNSIVLQTFSKFTVLSTVLHTLIKTIHSQNIA